MVKSETGLSHLTNFFNRGAMFVVNWML